MDKCYKLHGFPLGFKFKNNKNVMAYQVSSNLDLFQGNLPPTTQDFNSIEVTTHAPAFTPSQY